MGKPTVNVLRGPTTCLNHPVVTGTLAGCVTGSAFFNIALWPVTKNFDIVAIVDDLYVVCGKVGVPRDIAMSVCDRLKYTGLIFNGAKFRILDPLDGPAEVLGSIISATPNGVIQALDKKVDPVVNLMQLIQRAALRLHTKFHLFRTAQQRVKYLYETCSVSGVAHHCESFEQRALGVVRTAFSLEAMPTPHTALLQIPIGVGGCGLCYYSPMADLFEAKRIAAYNAFALSKHQLNPTVPEVKDIWPTHAMRGDNIVLKVFPTEPPTESKFLKHVLAPVARCNAAAHGHFSLHVPKQQHLIAKLPSSVHKIRDDAFLAMIFYRLAYIPERLCTIPCDRVVRTGTTEIESAFMHLQACPTCSMRTVRHNTVLYEMDRCFHGRLGVVTRVNPEDLPLPENVDAAEFKRGATGPDMLVFAQPMHCLDLTIVSPSAGCYLTPAGSYVARDPFRVALALKSKTYANFDAAYNMKCHVERPGEQGDPRAVRRIRHGPRQALVGDLHAPVDAEEPCARARGHHPPHGAAENCREVHPALRRRVWNLRHCSANRFRVCSATCFCFCFAICVEFCSAPRHRFCPC
jgi:hypothetical protein